MPSTNDRYHVLRPLAGRPQTRAAHLCWLAQQNNAPYWKTLEAAILAQQQRKHNARAEGKRRQRENTADRAWAAKERQDKQITLGDGLLKALD